MKKDLIIIGGGPGGYVAAIRATQLGASVTLVEKDKLGGTCLNRGCIPTKALFKNAQFLNGVRHSLEFGVTIDGYSLDFDKVQARKNTIVEKLRNGVHQLVSANGIEIIKGVGKVIKPGVVEVLREDGNSEIIEAERILIATGALPAKLKLPGIELLGVITSDELLEMEKIPKSIAIIGGGVIGIEFAGILRSMGSEVTVIEYLPSILPMFDAEITKKLTSILKKSGIRIETGAGVSEIIKGEEGLQVLAEGAKGQIRIDCEKVLLSTGRVMNIEGLNLDSLGIEYDNKGIRVDGNYETSVSRIYAIGDVVGKMMMAHVASDEGKAAVEKMFCGTGHMDYENVPSCVFTFPEIACVGISEEEAKNRCIDYSVSKFMLSGNGKALTMGEEDGMIKVIASRDRQQILGVHILGPCASDLIQEAVLAMKGMFTPEEVASAVYGHPSLSEAFAEAMEGINGTAIHMMPLKK